MEKPHKKLDAWKLSMDLVLDVYQVIEKFPRQEKYGLVDQIRRAVISIPSNIAEGAARQTKKEFSNYLHIAQGSLSELDTQLELAARLGYIDNRDQNRLDEKMQRIDKLITGLIRHLNKTYRESGRRDTGSSS
jgi:four helix bundle protein